MLNRLKSPLLWFTAALFLWVLGAKFAQINDYGSDLPFWDQWDAEAREIYLPWAEHRLAPRDFLAAHNEHRIVHTRALALGLLAANGQWDARVQTAFNALLYAGILAGLALFVTRHLSPVPAALFVLGTAYVMGLPIYAENTLAGFQSQFYFILLFALWNIIGATLARPGSLAWYLGHVAGAAGLFAMASGFTSSFIVAVIVSARVLAQKRRPTRWELGSLAWCALIIAAGCLLRDDVARHQALRAPSLESFFRSLLAMASWPTRTFKPPLRHLFTLILVLTPVLLVLVRWWKDRAKNPLATFVIGLAAWWAVQVVLLAYARGGESNGLSPRYNDTFALALIASLLAWLTWLEHCKTLRSIPVLLGTALALYSAGALHRELHFQVQHIGEHLLTPLKTANALREANIKAHVAGTLPSLADKKPWYEIPHYLPERLEAMLAQPAIRHILPASVRPAIPMKAVHGRPHEYASDFIRPELPYLRFHFSSAQNRPSLALETAAGNIIPVHLRQTNTTWIKTPDAPFRILAASASTPPPPLGEPVPWGRWSLLAFRIVQCGRPLMFGAEACFVFGLLLAYASHAGKRAAAARPHNA